MQVLKQFFTVFVVELLWTAVFLVALTTIFNLALCSTLAIVLMGVSYVILSYFVYKKFTALSADLSLGVI